MAGQPASKELTEAQFFVEMGPTSATTVTFVPSLSLVPDCTNLPFKPLNSSDKELRLKEARHSSGANPVAYHFEELKKDCWAHTWFS